MPTKTQTILVLALLAGCGNTMQLALEYADTKPVMVPVKIERSYITGVGVQLHPTDPRRAYVMARAGVADEHGYNGRSTWIARVDEIRKVYEGALFSLLAKDGKQCSTQSIPVPDLYAIEFQFDCVQ